MGGTDESSNLLELTLLDHAIAHKVLYGLWKKEEDRIAWLALSGQNCIQDTILESRRLGRKNADLVIESQYGKDWRKILSAKGQKVLNKLPEKRSKAFDDPKTRSKGLKAALNDASKQKRKQTMKKNGHQQGEKNSVYGRMWVTDGTKNLMVRPNEIPNGFIKGRIC